MAIATTVGAWSSSPKVAGAIGNVGCGAACEGGVGARLSADVACKGNLLINGSFESGLAGWTTESGATGYSANYARDGANTGYVVSSRGAEGRLTQQVAVQPNRAITFSFFSATHDRSGGPGQTVELRFYNAAGAEVGPAIIHQVDHWVDGDSLVDGPHVYNVTSPASATRANVIIRDKTSSYVKADGMCFEEGPPPPTPTSTKTPTHTPTRTPTPIPTKTAAPTPTQTHTPVSTSTDTPTPTALPTHTPTPRPSTTLTQTPVTANTPTTQPSTTPKSTHTAMPTPTNTPTAIATEAATPVPSRTSFPTPAPTGLPLGSIGDWVFFDRNADGQQNAGDWGVGSVTVKLFDANSGAFIKSAYTAGDGYYLFSNLPAGRYFVQFILPASSDHYWFTTAHVGPDATDSDANEVTGVTDVIELAADQANHSIDAGVMALSAIGDFVWEDTNENGVQDAGEPGITNMRVTLYDDSGNALRVAETNAAGYYEFKHLRPGTYSIGFTKPAGYEFTLENAGSIALDSDANPGSGRTTLIQLQTDQFDTSWDAGLKRLPTPTPISTASTATATPLLPTRTTTPQPSTTPLPPTATQTPLPSSTPPAPATVTETPANTATPVATHTSLPTSTPTRPPPTATQTPTSTSVPSATPNGSPTPRTITTVVAAACPDDGGTPGLIVGTSELGHLDVQAEFGSASAPWYCRVTTIHAQDAPPVGVVRAPFPRALVSYNASAAYVNGSPDAPPGAPPTGITSKGSGASSVPAGSMYLDRFGEPLVEGLYKDVAMHIRSSLLVSGTTWLGKLVPGPQWSMADRTWNQNNAQTQTAISVTYRYETSSWGLPLKGRAFDFSSAQPSTQQNLPAYLVELKVPLGWEYMWEWRKSVWIEEKIDGVPVRRLAWSDMHHTPSWIAVDMRDYGQDLPFVFQKRAKAGGLYQKVIYWDTGDEIRVPVVEVQSVLRDDCVFDSSCAAPIAEPDTLPALNNRSDSNAPLP